MTFDYKKYLRVDSFLDLGPRASLCERWASWFNLDSLHTSLLLCLGFVIIKIVCLLVTIAYYTLAERKIMGSVQRRRGPNVVGFWGLLQPLADGLKLLAKEMVLPSHSNGYIFLAAPIILLTLSLSSWTVVPFYLFDPSISLSSMNSLKRWLVHSDVASLVFSDFHHFSKVQPAFKTIDFSLFSYTEQIGGVAPLRYSMLFLLALSSLNVYGIILAGWSSSSKYAFLGSLRSAAQMISYEVAISLVVVSVVVLTGSLDLAATVHIQNKTIWFIFPLLPNAIIFFISMLAETNRAPFDLPEAEAELVAGYNVEYSSIIFAMFFLGEYSNMILMATLASLFFFGGWGFEASLLGVMALAFKIVIISVFFILVRASYPRYRYDQLMDIGWKIFLPVVTSFFIFEVGVLRCFNAFPYTNPVAVLNVQNWAVNKNWNAMLSLRQNNKNSINVAPLMGSKHDVPIEDPWDSVSGLTFILFDVLLPLSLVFCAILLIIFSNPMRSLFCLIGVFFQTVIVLLLAKIEFLSFVFLIIYIGAVSILFLFVVMLFNLKELRTSSESLTRLQKTVILLLVPTVLKLYFCLLTALNSFYMFYYTMSANRPNSSITSLLTTNLYDVQNIGISLYGDFAVSFILIGYILLGAMVGAIVLAMSTIFSPKVLPGIHRKI